MNINQILTCEELSETSKKMYYSRLKSWCEIIESKSDKVYKSDKPVIEQIIYNPEESCKLLRENIKTPSVATLHTYYSAIVAYIMHCETSTKKVSKELKEKWRQIQANNWENRPKYDGKPINQKQEIVSNKLKWSDIIKRRDELDYGSIPHLLLSMYTYLPPLRADYYSVEIINPNENSISSNNYMIIDDKEKKIGLYINDFKTSKKYGVIKHEIKQDNPLYNIIMESLKKSPRKYLFTMPSKVGEPFDRHGFVVWTSNLLRRIFPNIPISLTDFRHLHNSTIDYTNTPANKLEELGKSMGHSMEMQKKYQWT